MSSIFGFGGISEVLANNGFTVIKGFLLSSSSCTSLLATAISFELPSLSKAS